MKAALAYLKQHRNRFLNELIEYVAIPSISAQPAHSEDVKKCADWIHRHCLSIGLPSQICRTEGNPVVLATTRTPGKKSSKPHFVVYGHYDVQPPEPLELWTTPPFKPTVRAGWLYGRGASDNKGQHLAHLNAVEAFLKTGTPLPCDLTFLIEGEEEIGSNSLPAFIRKYKKQLECDAMVISDTGMPAAGLPALTYALRGIVALEVRLDGPDRDLHSGLFGGAVDNPAMVLAQLLAGLRDRNGKITIPGFYKDVKKLGPEEKKHARRLPATPESLRKFIGAPGLFGEKGFNPYEQMTARPTCEINGLTSGYQGAGSKTIIPSWASAKLTFRLVASQNPATAMKQITDHLKRICPPTVRLTITDGHGGEPYQIDPTSCLAHASLRALKAAFKKEPVLLREGGSIPIINSFSKTLGVDVILLGLALPDDNPHSPNEKFRLENYQKGSELGVHLWHELSEATGCCGCGD